MNVTHGVTTNGIASEQVLTGEPYLHSLDGHGAGAPQSSLSERPELLLGAAVAGGLLLAGLVSRLGR